MSAAEFDVNHQLASQLAETKSRLDQVTKPKGSDLLRRVRRSNGHVSEIYLGKKTLSPDLIDDDSITEILGFIKSDKSLSSITLSSKAIASPKHQFLLLEEIASKATVTNLRLFNLNDIPIKLFQKLMRLPLISLTFFECSLEGEKPDWLEIAAVLANCSTLHSMVFVNVDLPDALFKVLNLMPNLQRLIVEQDQLSLTAVETLLKGKHYRSLALHVNDATPIKDNIDLIKKALTTNNNLIGLTSSHPVFELAEMQAILKKKLEENRSLTSRDKIFYIIHEGRKTFSWKFLSPIMTAKIWKHLKAMDVKAVKEMIDTIGFDPNCFEEDHDDYDRNTFLNILVANEVHQKLVIWLLNNFKEYINPNEYDFEWKNLLLIATKVYTADSIVDGLLEHYGERLDMNAIDTHGRTALHYTFAYGKIELAKALIKLKADIHARDFQGKTPLDYAELPQEALEEILKSIDIDPHRDAKATMSHLLSYLGLFREEALSNIDPTTTDGRNAYEISTNIENLKLLKPILPPVHSKGDCKSKDQPKAPSGDSKAFAEQIESAKEYFCGKSVIQVCLEARPALREYTRQLQTKDAQKPLLTAFAGDAAAESAAKPDDSSKHKTTAPAAKVT